jgi:hypothetical protein
MHRLIRYIDERRTHRSRWVGEPATRAEFEGLVRS